MPWCHIPDFKKEGLNIKIKRHTKFYVLLRPVYKNLYFTRMGTRNKPISLELAKTKESANFSGIDLCIYV